MNPVELTSEKHILASFQVMRELRPHFVDEAIYFKTVQRLKDQYGYRLVGIFDEASEIVSAAGFKISESLSWGKHLYVDDLVTKSNVRSSGFGKKLLDWLGEEAIKNGCTELHLDSGVQRHAAHRFYLRERMDIVFYHFKKELK